MSPLVIAFQYFTIKCFKPAPVFLIGLVKFMQTDCFWFLVDFIFGQKSLKYISLKKLHSRGQVQSPIPKSLKVK